MSEQEALLANQEVFVALNAHDLEHFTSLFGSGLRLET